MKKLLFNANYIPAVSIMVRKDSLIKTGGFQQYPNLHCVDHPTLLALIPCGEFRYIPDYSLGYWVKHGDNVTISNYFNVLPIYRAAYYYFKKLPKNTRKDFFRYDFIMWLKLKWIIVKQILKRIIKQKFPFVVSVKRKIMA
jgi:hypothetical protein